MAYTMAFFFIPITTVHSPTPTSPARVETTMRVAYEPLYDYALDHLQTYNRICFGFSRRSVVVKSQNIALITLDWPSDFTTRHSLCKSISSIIEANFHPFKPISHFNLADYPEALL